MSTRYSGRASGITAALVGLFVLPGLCQAQQACPQVEPREGSFTRMADNYLKQAREKESQEEKRPYQVAAVNALRQGVEAEPENPLHYFRAGQVLSELGDYAAADSLWDRAVCLWQRYAERIDAQRIVAWRASYNQAEELLASGDTPGALEAYRRSYVIYDREPHPIFQVAVHCVELAELAEDDSLRQAYLEEATWSFREAATASLRSETLSEEDRKEFVRTAVANAAQLLAAQERYGEAAKVYEDLLALNPGELESKARQALFLTMEVSQLRESAQLAEDSAAAASLAARSDSLAAVVRGSYRELVAAEGAGLDAGTYHDIGLGLYELESFSDAAAAFQRALSLEPYRPQSLVMLAHNLYHGERYDTLLVVTERLVDRYPYSVDNLVLLAHARREQGQPEEALAALERSQSLPFQLLGLDVERGSAFGQLENRNLEGGTLIEVEFTFYDSAGNIVGTDRQSWLAPAPGELMPFQAVPEGPGAGVSGVSYRVLQPPTSDESAHDS